MLLCAPSSAHLCCIEPDPHRRQWLARTLESFLPHPLHSRVAVSGQDGRSVGNLQTEKYDKVGEGSYLWQDTDECHCSAQHTELSSLFGRSPASGRMSTIKLWETNNGPSRKAKKTNQKQNANMARNHRGWLGGSILIWIRNLQNEMKRLWAGGWMPVMDDVSLNDFT